MATRKKTATRKKAASPGVKRTAARKQTKVASAGVGRKKTAQRPTSKPPAKKKPTPKKTTKPAAAAQRPKRVRTRTTAGNPSPIPRPPANKKGAAGAGSKGHNDGGYIASGRYAKDVEAEMRGNPAARQVLKLVAKRKQDVFLRPVTIYAGACGAQYPSALPPPVPTQELTAAMCLLIRAGNYPEVAARAVGVSMPLFNRWVDWALKDMESEYGKWFRAVDAADAQDEVLDMAQISLMPKGWQALAFKRQGKSAQRWGQRVAHLHENIGDVTQRAADAPVQSFDGQAEVFAILEQVGYFKQLGDKNSSVDASATIIDADAVPTKKRRVNGKGGKK